MRKEVKCENYDWGKSLKNTVVVDGIRLFLRGRMADLVEEGSVMRLTFCGRTQFFLRSEPAGRSERSTERS